MASEHMETEYLAEVPAEQVAEWETLLLSACQMLDQMPPASMTSISVTGSLGAVEGSARSLVDVCRRIADEHGFRQTEQTEGYAFTVGYSRAVRWRPLLRRKLGPSI